MSSTRFSAKTNARFGAAILAIAPAVALLGSGYHPWIGSPGDVGFFQTLAAAIAADPTRWWTSHLIVAFGSGLLILAFLALRGHLRGAGEDRWSVLGVPFIVVGSTLYALLPAMELAPLGAILAGADAAAVQTALMPWFMPILRTSAALFALGILGFALGIARARVVRPASTWMVMIALGVAAAARFFPVGAVQLYVGPAAAVVALWPLAYAMWKQPQAGPGEQRQLTTESRQHFAAR